MVTLDLELVEKNASLNAQKGVLTRTLAIQHRTSVSASLLAMQQALWQSPIQSAGHLNRDDIFPPRLRGFAWQLLKQQSDAELVTLKAHDQSVRSVQFGRNDSVIAAISAAGLLRVLAVPSGSLLRECSQCQPNSGICFSPDGSFVFAALQGAGIAAIPVDDMDAERTLAPEIYCNGELALDDDGRTLVALTKQRDLLVIDLENGGTVVHEIEPDMKPIGIWFQDNDQHIGGVTRNGLWTTWTLDPFRQTLRFRLQNLRSDFSPLADAVFAPALTDGQGLAVRRGNNIALFVRLNPQPVPSSVNSITMLREEIESLVFAPPDSVLVVGHRHTCLRNLYGAEHDRIFHEPDTATISCAVAETGERFAVGCHDGSIRIRRIKPRSGVQQLLKPIDNNSEHELGAPIRSAVSLKRRLIVVGFRTGWVAMVDTTSAETVSRFRVAKTGITSLVLGSDESWLVCGTGKNNDAGLIVYSTQQIADTRSPDVGLTRAAPEPVASVSLASVRRLRLSDDGRHLFAGLLSGEIAVVDTETWTVNGRWQGHEHGIYALDARGALLVSGGSDGWVRCWNTDTRKLVCEWEAHSLRISDLKLHPNAPRVYTASFDETTAIWSLDGRLLSRLNGHSAAVRSLDISADGETLATGGDDYTLRLWDAVTGDAQLILRQLPTSFATFSSTQGG